jgi:DNA-directed RNA polymerase subunit F
MSNPEDYTSDILDRRFQVLMPTNDDFKEGFIRKSYFWNNPEKFSIREARDGLTFEYKGMQQHFKLSNARLEKLRRAKPGKVIQMTNRVHRHNNWFVILIDPAEEQENKEDVIRLEEINREIKEKIGDLLKEQRELRSKIQKYKLCVK